MRCPDCGKFVGFDDGNVDEVEAEIDEDTGTVTIDGRIVLPCAECGTELKELNVDETYEVVDEFKNSVEADIENATGGTTDTGTHAVKYEFVGDPDVTYSERKHKGKTLKGATIAGKVKRTITGFDTVWPGAKLEAETEFEHTVEDSPSSFDELV